MMVTMEISLRDNHRVYRERAAGAQNQGWTKTALRVVNRQLSIDTGYRFAH